jgi:enoyl-CoA hydratase
MSKVLFERTGRIGRITLNRPEVMNAIDEEVPALLSDAVAAANREPEIRVIVLSGKGRAFCAGYDLTYYTGGEGRGRATQDMPWDPMKDFAFMSRNTDHFMALWRSHKPVICRVQGHALAGGSDIALCADMIVMAEDATIGYMPARVWGCPTTAMWVYRLGPEQAKRMLLTGDRIDGIEAQRIGLVLKAVPSDQLDAEVEALARRIATVPANQLITRRSKRWAWPTPSASRRCWTASPATRPRASPSAGEPRPSAGSRRSRNGTAASTTGPRTDRSTRRADRAVRKDQGGPSWTFRP